MYFKYSGRVYPDSGRNEPCLRLAESYRNLEGRVCHRTILHIGFARDRVTPEQLNHIGRLLTNRHQHKITLFEHEDELVRSWANDLWQRIVAGNRIDLSLFAPDNRKIDADTMQHSNVRETGAESICHNIFKELHIDKVLQKNGFTAEQAILPQTTNAAKEKN